MVGHGSEWSGMSQWARTMACESFLCAVLSSAPRTKPWRSLAGSRGNGTSRHRRYVLASFDRIRSQWVTFPSWIRSRTKTWKCEGAGHPLSAFSFSAEE